MRAMTASGMVPSTMVGSIKWLRRGAEGALLSGEERVDQHEAGDRLEEEEQISIRPDTGVQRRNTEEKRISSRPHQKIGME